jgi:FixJ family two-component response regulator
MRSFVNKVAAPSQSEATSDMAAQQTVVIVVDDNAGFLKGVARLLAHNGIESRTFASAEALPESDGAQTATCLLLDIHLGGISGIELQRQLAASGSKYPVIFMTANDGEATRNEAVDAGCIAYLRKPFTWHVLLDAIGESCGLRPLTEAALFLLRRSQTRRGKPEISAVPSIDRERKSAPRL